ncbi:MAG: dTMP kinase [Methanosphaera sp.]|uniref:dTMP kinase n=1 Tax=Methanosphaera sp. TaxID=2666342 RepID=UPI002E7909C7|nr:dTMP kinase [Methanosphaera sp.]MEE1116771.1 dTMP kinase [Methanosphaera sp.]MEE3323997.1 dTMP kinase [Methanosphaera sp.]
MYIVLEGIDGAGKSTQTELLNDWLTGKGYRTKKIVEPTTSDIGKVIRKELLNPESTNDINQQRLTLLFAADRLTLKKEILDAKDSKDIIIISDRSFYSSICYQNNSSVDKDWIYEVNLHTPRPDLTILLDLDEKEAITRCDREEAFENIQFLEKTRKNYLDLLEIEDNIVVVDAKDSLNDVQEKIRKIVQEKLGL